MQYRLFSQTPPTTVDQLEQLLLEERGIADVTAFFNPTHPLKLSAADMQIDPTAAATAAQRLLQAVETQEKIVIAGDYDADGLTATATLWLALEQFGIRTEPWIPDRLKHGYGLNERSLPDLLALKPDVLITVDNGIVAHQAIQALADKGVTVIVTDHHQPEEREPVPTAALTTFHTTSLCGAGVAWLFAREVAAEIPNLDQSKTSEFLTSLLDLVVIGTLADQVLLLDQNRSMAYHGLRVINQTQRPGIAALLEIAAALGKPVTEQTISYAIAPRLNAMGRIAHGMEALRLLCSKSPAFAKKRAQLLQETNEKRQGMTHDQLQLARSQANKQKTENIIVVQSEDFHEGVIGLLAGRLCEELGKPVVALSVGEFFVKGSARSVDGIDITALLRDQRQFLLEVGGHPRAAGVGLLPEQVTNFVTALQKQARNSISPEQLQQVQDVVCELPHTLLNLETVDMFERFRPFGEGNREPVFLVKDLIVESVKQIGAKGQHVKMQARTTAGDSLTLLAWNQAQKHVHFSISQQLHAISRLEVNQFRGDRQMQGILIDLTLCRT